MADIIGNSKPQRSPRPSTAATGATPTASNSPYITVAVPAPVRQAFSYLDPKGEARRGARVRVPFRGKQAVGLVLSCGEAPAFDLSRIKPISGLVEGRASVPESFVSLCEWAANYYVHPIGEVVAAALPPLIRHGREPHIDSLTLALTQAGKGCQPSSLARSPAQGRLLQALRQSDLNKDALKQQAFTTQVVNSLVAKGYAEWRQQPQPQGFTLHDTRHPSLALTDEQRQAINAVGSQGTYLLQGITGSGKTEVYLRLVEATLKAGKQALVLVPEIGLTPQTVQRFQARFEVDIAVLHSGLTDRERALAWMQAQQGSAGLVLGTRSAIFTPLRYPGLIVIDEEHDTSFKQQEGFRYNARDLAVLRGSMESVPVILGSATPSLESLANAQQGRYQRLELTHRPASFQQENYQIMDTSHLPMKDGLSQALKQRIAATLDAGNQALLFINRRGYAPVLHCNSCGWIAGCRRCDARLTYHTSSEGLYCHHCGIKERRFNQCQECESSDLSPLGVGTQRVEEHLAQAFAGRRILRIDRDSTRKSGALNKMFQEVAEGGPAILVGTQLLAKGHHFPGVTLVALLDLDGAFYTADFRALERMGQLVLQVGGRAGRESRPGQVVIQTKFATHPLLKLLLGQGYSRFADEVLKERQQTGLPPYAFHALIRASSQDRQAAAQFLEALATADPSGRTQVLGPVPALMERKAGRHRLLLLLSAQKRSHLHGLLMQKVSQAEASKLSRKVRWAVDVDPYDIF